MTSTTLEDRLRRAGNPVTMMRNAQVGPYVFPIPAEFSNWRDEQEAWRKSVVLFDQSYHMTDLYLEGPDVVPLLSGLAINSFKDFGRNRAKQIVCCNYGGYVIGDAVLLGLEEQRVNITGRPTIPNWVEFHASTGGYRVRTERDERGRSRKTFRYQLQGPHAFKLLEKLNGGPLPEIRFFHMGAIRIAGRPVRALRHGMAGAPGLEFWGPADEGAEIKGAILEAGAEFGLRQAGGRAYATSASESGWVASPLPAIYSGARMRAYREWLKADAFEATASLGGSFDSDNVEDYYLTPWDLGYGKLIAFDHEFVGREALERLEGSAHRRKVTLHWNREDVVSLFATMFQTSDRAKYLEMPASHYATHPFDAVLKNGRLVGLSTYSAYTSNGREWISLAMVDDSVSSVGTELAVMWGEKDGGSSKPVVERHVQRAIRATVGPSPYCESTRLQYRADAR